MALLYIDGFDAGDVARKWIITGGTTGSVDTRFGVGRSAQLPGGGTNPTMSKTLSSNYTTMFIGFSYKQNLADSITFLNLVDSGGTTRLSVTSLYPELRVTAGSLVLTTSTAGLQPNYWYNFEIAVTFAASGGTLEIRKEGATIATNSGSTGAVTVNRILFSTGGSFWQNSWVDDLYVCDNSGSSPHNTFLGDIRIHTLVPDGAGSTTQMTPSAGANYSTVDELPYNATDYVRGSAGQTDLYTSSDLPAGVGTIFGVQANAIVKKSDAGNLSGRTKMKSGATTVNGASVALSSSDATISDTRALNPDTLTSWTSGDINSIEVGVEAL